MSMMVMMSLVIVTVMMFMMALKTMIYVTYILMISVMKYEKHLFGVYVHLRSVPVPRAHIYIVMPLHVHVKCSTQLVEFQFVL